MFCRVLEPPCSQTFPFQHDYFAFTYSRHIRYIPAFLALIALLLSFYGFRCNFVQFVSKVNGPDGPISIHFGYWSHQSWTVTNSTNGLATEKTCEWYPVDATAPDKTFKVGRTFNLFALVLGASFILLDILSGCVSTAPNRGILQAGAIGYLLCCLCSGLSLLILQVCSYCVLISASLFRSFLAPLMEQCLQC